MGETTSAHNGKKKLVTLGAFGYRSRQVIGMSEHRKKRPKKLETQQQ
jgi:hypothetical protein